MTVLFLATRPPWPTSDGGRVLMARTLDGLRARGHAVTVVAPTSDAHVVPEALRGDWLRTIFVPVRPKTLVRSILGSLARRRPGSMTRHQHPAVAQAVAELLSHERIDIVHVEQLHALSHAEAAFAHRIPVVLRAENIESDLWHASAAVRPWGRVLGEWEARKLARWERASLERVALTIALTEKDASGLGRLAPDARIAVVRAPMPSVLADSDRTLEGAPAIVLLCSQWFPNRDGVTWFVRDIWPVVFASLPRARLHLFGKTDAFGAVPGAIFHPAPDEARDVFVRGSIFVVPPRIASGASMKILEAWARGIPVVATPAAAAGLDASGAPVALASTPAEFTSAFRMLCESRHAVDRAVDAGRAVLREHHDLDKVAAEFERLYTAVVAQGTARGTTAARSSAQPAPYSSQSGESRR